MTDSSFKTIEFTHIIDYDNDNDLFDIIYLEFSVGKIKIASCSK